MIHRRACQSPMSDAPKPGARAAEPASTSSSRPISAWPTSLDRGLPTADENDQVWRDIWYDEAHQPTASMAAPWPRAGAGPAGGRPIGRTSDSASTSTSEATPSGAMRVGHALESTSGAGLLIARSRSGRLDRLAGRSTGPCAGQEPPLQRQDRPAASGVTTSRRFKTSTPRWTAVERCRRLPAAAPRAAGDRSLVLLARLHATFEAIHPFRDGNGRTADWCSTCSSCATAIRPRSSASATATATCGELRRAMPETSLARDRSSSPERSRRASTASCCRTSREPVESCRSPHSSGRAAQASRCGPRAEKGTLTPAGRGRVDG